MTVLSRFSMNSAAATRAVTCGRRCGICLWESAARRIALQHGPARLLSDVSCGYCYGCSPISRNGNKSVAPGRFNPGAATTAAQSGKRLQ